MKKRALALFKHLLAGIARHIGDSIKIYKDGRVIGYRVHDYKSHEPIILAVTRDECPDESSNSREEPCSRAEIEQTEAREP